MATNINQIKTGINGVPVYGTDFTYTGNYQIISEDDSGNWKIKFLTSGTFTAMNDVLIDIFAVGGAGAGGYGESGAGVEVVVYLVVLIVPVLILMVSPILVVEEIILHNFLEDLLILFLQPVRIEVEY